MAMHQFLETPHLTDEIIGRLIRYESHLVEVKHELKQVNQKLDYLLSLPTVDRTSGFHDLPAPICPDQTQTQSGPLGHDFFAPNGPDQTQTQNGPLGLGFNALGPYTEGGYRWDLDSNLETLAPAMGDLYTLPPRTPPASIVFRDGEWADPIPPGLENGVVPSHLPTPSGVTMSHPNTFPGSGNDDYQSTLQWTDIFGQMAEMSSNGLVTTKPKDIENEIQQESNVPTASRPWGSFNRNENIEQKAQRLGQICGVLDIPQKWKELPVLQTIIQRLGGTVPTTQEPIGQTTRSERVRMARDARHACFEELGRLVELDGGRVRELKILDKVLAMATQVKRYEEWYEAQGMPGPSA